MYQRQRLKNIISRIREIMRIIILELDYMNDWDRQEVMNAITEIRCECTNLEQDVDELFEMYLY